MSNIKIKDKEIKFLSPALLISALILASLLIILFLYQNNFIALPEDSIRIFNNVLLVFIILFAVTVISRLTKKYVHRFFDEPEEKIFYSKIYIWSLFAIGLLIILNHFGVSLSNITIFIGLMATGLAFAVRDILVMIIAWMILLRKKPFKIGDYIRIGEDEGKVKHIGTFYVLLDKAHNLPDDFIRVPNRLFLEKSVNNLGKNQFFERLQFRLEKFPEGSSLTIENLKSLVQSSASGIELLSVYIDIIDEKLMLVVEYLVEFKQRQYKRSEIVKVVVEECREFVYFPTN